MLQTPHVTAQRPSTSKCFLFELIFVPHVHICLLRVSHPHASTAYVALQHAPGPTCYSPKAKYNMCFYLNKYLCHMFKYVCLAVQLFFEKMVHLLLCSACCNLIQQMHVNSSTWDMLLSDMKADKPKQGYIEQPMRYMQKCGQATHWEMQPR